MKAYIIIFLVALTATSFAQTIKPKHTDQLMDSLQGKWIVTQVTSNKKAVEPTGFLEFTHDGKFVTNNTWFGNGEGKYNTNEGRSTIYVEFEGNRTEWRADVRQKVLRLELVRKEKEPRVRLVLNQPEPGS